MKTIVTVIIIVIAAAVIFAIAKNLRKKQPINLEKETIPLEPTEPVYNENELGKVVEIENEEHFMQLTNSGKVCIVAFHSPNCGWCVKLMPTLDELAQLLGNKIIVSRADISKLSTLGQKYVGNGVPDIKRFYNGQMMDKGYNGDRSLYDLEKYSKS